LIFYQSEKDFFKDFLNSKISRKEKYYVFISVFIRMSVFPELLILMGTICSSPGIVLSQYRKNSILIFSNSDLFSSLYTISERVLNETPKSEVRLCRKNSSQNIYVLKKVSSESKVFSLEAKILKRLNHPHIIKLIQCFSYDSQSYLVLEYLQHGDLGHYLRNTGKMNEKTASNVVFQIANALDYLHRSGIYHRDVKPDNVLLGSIGKKGIFCKLADFDSAGFIISRDREPFGTLPYMAPEMFEQNYNEKVDLWSLGVCLFRMLTGHLPFNARCPEEIEIKIRTARLQIDQNLSDYAKDLIGKLIERNSEIRLSASQVLKHEFVLAWNSTTSNNSNHQNNSLEKPQKPCKLFSHCKPY
jgi:serine/threonine protein kinase